MKNDESIFDGWVETQEVRFENRGNDIWGVYKRRGNAFIFDGTIFCNSSDPAQLIAQYDALEQ